MKIFAADFVLPITSEPIENGAIAIIDDAIISVGRAPDLRKKFPDASFEDFGPAAILPGFVNCHSHLEITAMRGLLDSVEHDFTSWLLTLNAARQRMSEGEIETAAVAGAAEGARAGVTCFGDIGRMGRAGLNALKKVGLRGIVFQETEFSPDNRTADQDFERLIVRYEELRSEATELVNVGLSPHSPYTVGSRLFEQIAQYSILNKVPITVHAAESAHEVELLEKGTGLFTNIYEKYDVEWNSPLCSPVEYLERLGVLAARPLLAHCVQVSASDIGKIYATGSSIAHCPKSNAKFGHGFAPFEQFLEAGIAVGLGSDSVASNNICDLLEEGRFASLVARNRPESRRFIAADEILKAATLGGANALGLEDMTGSLESGKQADICVVSLQRLAQQPISDIHASLVFSSSASDVQVTMVAGSDIFRSGAVLKIDKTQVANALGRIANKLKSTR